MAEKLEVSNVALLALALLGWFWYSKNYGAGRGSNAAGAHGADGCGCNSRLDGPPIVTQQPANADGSQTLTGAVPFKSGLAGGTPILVGGNAPQNAPGSVWKDGGRHWSSNVRRVALGLTPRDVPNAPDNPAGAGVWVANATPERVQ